MRSSVTSPPAGGEVCRRTLARTCQSSALFLGKWSTMCHLQRRIQNCCSYRKMDDGRLPDRAHLGRNGFVFVRCQSEGAVGESVEFCERDKPDDKDAKPILKERVGKQSIRSFWLDKSTGAMRVEVATFDQHPNSCEVNGRIKSQASPSFRLPDLPQFVVDFILPAGYPESVSDEYLQYMLWQFPTHVTGWTCRTLVTSSLLAAVGIGGDAGTAAATAAAVKWVTRDGLGAVGRFIIGGRFGNIFDEDPKQWRLYADLIGSGGGILELATPLAPAYFVPLASLGRLTKAVAQGLKDPSSRVIQNHFATSDNLGDISAKEEVWDVAAQLVGLAAGVSILSYPAVDDYWELVVAWASIRSIHLWLRYKSLEILRLRTINHKRALILIEAFIQGLPIPGIKDCNASERMLVSRYLMNPSISIGCSISDVVENGCSRLELESLLTLYELEDYILVLRLNAMHKKEACIVLKEGATSMTVFRSMWQASWLLASTDFLEIDPSRLGLERQMEMLTTSLHTLHNKFDIFLEALRQSGWDASKLVLRVPNSAPFICK